MAEQTQLFIGLIRPPKFFGLPITYVMVWLFGSTLLFIWTQHWLIAVSCLAAYPILWKAADWDERFLDVIVTTIQNTPPTRNRKVHGGDSYAP